MSHYTCASREEKSVKMKIQTKNGFDTKNVNRRKAIRHQCLNCSEWNRAEVENCQHDDCPLCRYRRRDSKQDAKARAKGIRAYCLWCMNGQLMEVARCHIRTCSLFPYRKTKVDRSVELPQDEHIEASQQAV